MADAPAEEAPLEPYVSTLSFSFDFTPQPPPPPPPEGEEPPVVPTLDGTFFSLTIGPPPGEDGSAPPPTFELAHPLSGEEGPASSTADLEVGEALVRWLVVEQQGMLSLSLRRKGPAEGGDPAAASHEVCALPLDFTDLIFGRDRVSAVWDASPNPDDKPSKKAKAPSPLPEAAVALASRLSVGVRAQTPLLPENLAESLNPMSVIVVRTEDMPPDWSGDNRVPGDEPGRPKYRRPFEELALQCDDVRVRWHLLGETFTTSGRPHGRGQEWREQRLFLAGVLGAEELQRRLRDEQIVVEVRDRDPKAPAAPVPAAAPSAEEEGSRPASKGKKKDPKAEAAAAAAAEAEAAAAAAAAATGEPEVEQPPPFGTARAQLGELLPKCATQKAAYAPHGVPVAASRRMTLAMQVTPCERPEEKPPPEAEVLPYFPGKYVEHATHVTLKLELARPLPFLPQGRMTTEATDHAQSDELQRIVTMLKYNDTPSLVALQRVLEMVNEAAGMQSASAWETYKDEWREELDIVSGVQLVDSEVRLFLLEGQAAIYDDDGTARNAMAKLGALLARTAPNEGMSFTLADTHLLFPNRLYNSFETPVKLIKIRAALPALLRKPEVYQHMRVKPGCQAALLSLGGLLRTASIRLAHKNSCFPLADDLLQMEKKYAAVILPHDREGVPMERDESDESVFDGPAGTHRSHKKGHRESRHGPLDQTNPLFVEGLRAREAGEVPVPDYIGMNKVIPPPPPRAPLPEWYMVAVREAEAAAQANGMVYGYSGQRLNQTEVQKAALRTQLYAMDTLPSYSGEYLWADGMGERELPRMERGGKEEGIRPWDNTEPIKYLRPGLGGMRSRFRMLQPSEARCEELQEQFVPPENVLPGCLPPDKPPPGKPRFDALPSKKPYLDENPERLFKSVFQQTEEQIAAEHAARIDNVIDEWKSKLVVDDPVLKISLKSRDQVCQQDRLTGLLQDHAQKRSLKALYRGKHKLTGGDHRQVEPSAFMHESTIDQLMKFEESLRDVEPQKWYSTKKLGKSVDFNAGYVNPKESLLPVSKETKRPIRPMEQHEKTGLGWGSASFAHLSQSKPRAAGTSFDHLS